MKQMEKTETEEVTNLTKFIESEFMSRPWD